MSCESVIWRTMEMEGRKHHALYHPSRVVYNYKSVWICWFDRSKIFKTLENSGWLCNSDTTSSIEGLDTNYDEDYSKENVSISRQDISW